MKKILTLTSVALLTSAFVPAAMAQWDFINRSEIHAAGVYSKPSNNGTELGALNSHVISSNLNNSIQQAILSPELDFRWNYALGYSYLLCGTETRFFMDYEYFQDHDELNGQVLNYFNSNPTLGLTGNLFGRVEQAQNMFRLGVSHYLPFGCQYALDTSVYFEYDRLIQNTIANLYDANLLLNQQSGIGDVYSYLRNKMHGAGPGIGLKIIGSPFAYCPQLKFFGGLMSTLLYARQMGDFQRAGFFPSLQTSNEFTLKPKTNYSLISKFDIDLGVDYSQKACVDGGKMLLGVTLGIRYVNMINAIKYSNSTILLQGQNASNYNPVDWGRAGPYIQFRLGGADAHE